MFPTGINTPNPNPSIFGGGPAVNPLAAALANAGPAPALSPYLTGTTPLPGAPSNPGPSPNLTVPQSFSSLGVAQPGAAPGTPLGSGVGSPGTALAGGGLVNGTLTGQTPAATGTPLVAPYSGPAANPLVAPYSGPAATPLATPPTGNTPFGFGSLGGGALR